MGSNKTDLPTIILESGWLLDDSLAQLLNVSLNQTAVDGISSRINEFKTIWETTGAPLLAAAVEASNLAFKESDIKGVLVCGPLSSHSHPLIVNV